MHLNSDSFQHIKTNIATPTAIYRDRRYFTNFLPQYHMDRADGEWVGQNSYRILFLKAGRVSLSSNECLERIASHSTIA
jgi:hypothetical protein